jgi:Lrp/AsnC family transcriptional regulator, leucine-responsive regulatory protein
MTLDRINARLLEILQKDARTSVSELARVLQRAESTTRERLALLEKRGFITGYQAVIDPVKVGYRIQAIIRADCDMATLPELGRRLRTIPNVVSAQMTTGPKPIRIEVVADDLSKLEEVVSKRISPLQLRDVEIGLIVQKLVETRPPPIRMEGQTEALPLPVAENRAMVAEEIPLVQRGSELGL